MNIQSFVEGEGVVGALRFGPDGGGLAAATITVDGHLFAGSPVDVIRAGEIVHHGPLTSLFAVKGEAMCRVPDAFSDRLEWAAFVEGVTLQPGDVIKQALVRRPQ